MRKKLEAAVARSLEGKQVIIAGISGGADSTALLRSLCAARTLMPELHIIAAHCNFQLRGEESLRDEKFVTDLCDRLNVALEKTKFATTAYAEEHSLSIEMACRKLRYDYFTSLRQKYSADAIAIAHNSDDNIETLLINLLRGSGSKGLQGMTEYSESENGDLIMRPLLRFSRKDIEGYLDEYDQDYITDSTNLESDYRRNFLRNEIIPALQSRWPEAKKGILRSREILEHENNLVSQLSENIVETSNGITGIKYSSLSGFTEITPLLHRTFSKYGANSAQIVEMAKAIARKESGKRWILTKGEVRLTRDGVCYSEIRENEDEEIIGIPENLKCRSLEMTDTLMNEIKANRSQEILFMDADPRNHPFLWRRPRRRDRIRPLGMKGSSLLSDIIKDAHLSVERRRNLWVLENTETSEIIWVKGLKRSKFNLISPKNSVVFMIY